MIKEQLKIWEILCIIIFVLGVSFGIYLCIILDGNVQGVLENYIFQTPLAHSYMDLIGNFKNEFLMWIKIFILGLSFIGLPFLYLYTYLKGVGIGFSISFIYLYNNWNSLVKVIIVGILPKILYVLPLLIILMFAIWTSRNLYNFNTTSILQSLLKYTLCMLLLLVLLLVVNTVQWLANFLL